MPLQTMTVRQRAKVASGIKRRIQELWSPEFLSWQKDEAELTRIVGPFFNVTVPLVQKLKLRFSSFDKSLKKKLVLVLKVLKFRAEERV